MSKESPYNRLRRIIDKVQREALSESEQNFLLSMLPKMDDVVSCVIDMRDNDWEGDTDRICHLLNTLEGTEE